MRRSQLLSREELIVRTFLLKCIREKRESKDEAARKIQKCFREKLYRQQNERYIQNIAALRIQRFWRNVLNKTGVETFALINRFMISLGYRDINRTYKPIPYSTKRKILVTIDRPTAKVNTKKLSNEQIDQLEKDREANLKWASKSLVPQIIKKVFDKMDGIQKVWQKNAVYGKRLVPVSFYTPITHFAGPNMGKQTFVHESTFRILTVGFGWINETLINVEAGRTITHELPFSAAPIDSAMDPRSGRVFLLLKGGRISTFTSGQFSKPKRIDKRPPMVPMQKYITTDKFGHLWVIGSSSFHLLDTINFTVLKSFDVLLLKGAKIGNIHLLTRNRKEEGFLIAERNGPAIYHLSLEGKPTTNVSLHTHCIPKFVVTKEHLFTYGADHQVVIYGRECGSFVHRKTIKTELVPLSLVFVRQFNIIIVGFSDSTLGFISLTGEPIEVNIPRENLPFELQKYYDDAIPDRGLVHRFSKYSIFQKNRLPASVNYMKAVPFSQDCILLVCQCADNMLRTLVLNKFSYRVKAHQASKIKYPPIFSSPHVMCSQMAYEDLTYIAPYHSRLRLQLERDSVYLQQISGEVEKRFLKYKFGQTKTIDCAKIMLQSPYRRWIPYLNFAKPELTIDELFAILSETAIMHPIIDTPEKLCLYVSECLSKPGPILKGMFGVINQMTLNETEITDVLQTLSSLFKTELERYETFRENSLSAGTKLPALYLKRLVNDYHEKTLHRFTEIENIIKNKIRTATRQEPPRNKKPVRCVKIPDIYLSTTLPLFNRKAISKLNRILPDPLFEAYRYRSHRDVNIKRSDIEYCQYAEESNSVEIIPISEEVSNVEVQLTRALNRFGMCNAIIAMSADKSKLAQHYPLETVPLSYILEANPFSGGSPPNLLVARFWLSQILILIGTLHKQNITLRSVLPGNFCVSFDGSSISLLTMADAALPKASTLPKLPYANEERWLPPEYFDGDSSKPSFDIFQFGILTMKMLTDSLPPSFGDVLKQYKKFRPNENAVDIANSKNFFFDPFQNLDLKKFGHFTLSGEKLAVNYEIDSNESFMDIVSMCLDLDASRRPSVRQLLDHPLFNLNLSNLNKAKMAAPQLIYNVPMSVFVNGLFGSICSTIDSEMMENPSATPTIHTAVNILDYFLNSSSNMIKFPVKNAYLSDVVTEVFKQRIFDRIVLSVIESLRLRFEEGQTVKEDNAFNALINLYFELFRRNTNYDFMSQIKDSFIKLCTGIDGSNETYMLFIFIHERLRPLVEFFFTKTPPEARRVMELSDFYCTSFLSFFDNMRDFATAFLEKSERRHAASLKYLYSFIEAYPNSDTTLLLKQFAIEHKIEQSLMFEQHEVRMAALMLATRMMAIGDMELFNDITYHVLPYFLYNESHPYPEKIAAISLSRDIMLSQSYSSILQIMRSGILNALLFCTEKRQDKGKYLIWGEKEELPVYKHTRRILKEITSKGISSISAVILCSLSMTEMMKSIGCLSESSGDFGKMVDDLEKGIIDKSLMTTMAIAEKSSLTTITAITRQSQQVFENSLIRISKCLVNNSISFEDLFKSVISIWESHQLEIYEPLMLAIVKQLEKGRMSCSITALKLIQRSRLLDCFLPIPEHFLNIIERSFDSIREMTKRRQIDDVLIQHYADYRSQRVSLLKAIINHPDSRLGSILESRFNFSEHLFSWILDPSKFEINLKVVPQSFAKYNRTFPIRSEAITYLKLIVQSRGRGSLLFGKVLLAVQYGGLLVKECDLLRRVGDKSYRRTCVRLLNILATEDDIFGINEAIARSDLLMELRDEALSDWENFQLLKNAWKRREKLDQKIYGQVKGLYDNL